MYDNFFSAIGTKNEVMLKELKKKNFLIRNPPKYSRRKVVIILSKNSNINQAKTYSLAGKVLVNQKKLMAEVNLIFF